MRIWKISICVHFLLIDYHPDYTEVCQNYKFIIKQSDWFFRRVKTRNISRNFSILLKQKQING